MKIERKKELMNLSLNSDALNIFNAIRDLIQKDIKVFYSYALMGNGEFLKFNEKSFTLTFKDITNKISFINPEFFKQYTFKEFLNDKHLFNFYKIKIEYAEIKEIQKELV
jgi:hypothetical protein